MEMTKEVKEIMDNIKFTYRKSDNQTAHMFSSGHIKYICKISYNGKTFQTTYQCNPQYSDMSKIKFDFIYCLLLDKETYDNALDEEDFANNLAMDYYEDKKEVKRIYKACQRASCKLDAMFSQEELDILDEFFREW